MLCKLLVIVAGVGYIQALKLPSYIVPCHISDPKFKQCAIQHGQNAIPELVKGDKSYKVPVLEPLTLPKLILNSRSNLLLNMTDAVLSGLSNMIIKDFDFDEKARVVKVEIFNENIKIVGDYNIDGKLLILPIQGYGIANFTFIDGTYFYKLRYNLIEKRGQSYMNITDSELKLSLKNLRINLENLFNGDKTLGPQMNSFMNENWIEIIDEFRDAISTTFSQIVTTIVVGVCQKVPFDHVILT